MGQGVENVLRNRAENILSTRSEIKVGELVFSISSQLGINCELMKIMVFSLINSQLVTIFSFGNHYLIKF